MSGSGGGRHAPTGVGSADPGSRLVHRPVTAVMAACADTLAWSAAAQPGGDRRRALKRPPPAAT